LRNMWHCYVVTHLFENFILKHSPQSYIVCHSRGKRRYSSTPVLHSYSNLLHPYSTHTPVVLRPYSSLLHPYSDLNPVYPNPLHSTPAVLRSYCTLLRSYFAVLQNFLEYWSSTFSPLMSFHFHINEI
jgi:hypothetical protein